MIVKIAKSGARPAICPLIKASHARVTLDRLDANLLRSVFAPEAVIDLGAIYRGEVNGFVETALTFMSSMQATRHELSNLYVHVDALEARAETYVRPWHLISDDEGERELVMLGRYLDILRLVGDAWLIVRHAELIDWGSEYDTSTRWFRARGGEIAVTSLTSSCI